jgi:hypothetical protein
MSQKKLKHEILPCLEKVIKFSLTNNLKLHSSVGGKYGELLVASKLWKYDPRLGDERKWKDLKGIRNPTSCDIILAATKKKLEVKWAMLHHKENDNFIKAAHAVGIPFWGWGFSIGGQFKENRFDYCLLLAAKKDEAHPQHVFVITCEEMKRLMGDPRPSGVWTGKSHYVEFSGDKNYYWRRKWYPQGPSPIEKSLFEERRKYERRWQELRNRGEIAT